MAAEGFGIVEVTELAVKSLSTIGAARGLLMLVLPQAAKILFAAGGTTILRPVLRLGALALMLPLLAGCERKVELHQRVTVHVRDGGVMRVGSGVWKVVARDAWPFDSGRSMSSLDADAISIDLPGRGLLLMAPLNGRADETMFLERAATNVRDEDRIGRLRRLAKSTGLKRTLPCPSYPNWADDDDATNLKNCFAFGYMSDPKNIKTYMDIVPGEITVGFPLDIQIVKTVFEVTNDRPTLDLGTRLPWLNSVQPDPGLNSSFAFKRAGLPMSAMYLRRRSRW